MADNVLTYKGNGIIQIMSTAELNSLSQAVLEYMAANDGPGGIYTSNVGNASFTLIGTFTDTQFAGNIGDGNVTVLSSEYGLYQDLTTPTGTEPPRPLRYESTTEPVRAMSTSQLLDLANTILQYGLTNEGPSSYVLQTTAPSDGGTWTSLGQLKDVYSGGIETPKYLYKKLTSGSYTLNRPLKSLGNGTIQSFTTTEINYIAKKVREQIVNTGVGQYRFQASAPTPGTWVEKGSIVDTRATEVTGVLYASTYTGADIPYTTDVSYTLDTPTPYSGPYYTADVATDYTGTTSNEFFDGSSYTLTTTNTYTNTQFTSFVGVAPVYYAGAYTGLSTAYYTLVTPVNYTNDYTGTPPAYYTLVTPVNYTLENNVVFESSGFTGTYSGTYTNVYYTSSYQAFVPPPVAFWTFYNDAGDGLQYTTIGTVGFSVFVGSPTGYYTGPTPPVYYLGPGPGPIPVQPYTNQPETGYFAAPFPAIGIFYTGLSFGTTYTRDAVTYTGPTLGPVCYVGEITFNSYGTPSFLDFYTGSYTTDSVFTGAVTNIYTGTSTPTSFGSVTFTGTVTNYYTGIGTFAYFGSITYTGTTPANYTGISPVYYTGPDTVNTYTVTYSGERYTGVSPAGYYNLDYTGIVTSTFTGSVLYTGAAGQYDTDYTGSSISNTPVTVSTIKLWRRVA